MWRFTLFFNVLITTLLWLVSMVTITPAYNLLVQNTVTKAVLPILTDYAFTMRYYMLAIPITWAVFTLFYGKWIKDHAHEIRNERVLIHATVSLVLGLLLLLFFSLAGILPFLKCCAEIS